MNWLISFVFTASIVALTVGAIYSRTKYLEAKEAWDRWMTRAEKAEANNRELAPRVNQLEDQIEGARAAVQTAADDITLALPGLKDGDWGLIVLVRKLINELNEAKELNDMASEVFTKLRGILAARPGEGLTQRAQFVACRAAIAGAIADMFGVPPGSAPEAVMEAVHQIVKTKDLQESMTKDVTSMQNWLGARKDESLRETIQRVITTAEVAPGAATELQKCRALMEIPAGQSVLESLKDPIDFVATVTKRKGEIISINLAPQSHWLKIGSMELKNRDVEA